MTTMSNIGSRVINDFPFQLLRLFIHHLISLITGEVSETIVAYFCWFFAKHLVFSICIYLKCSGAGRIACAAADNLPINLANLCMEHSFSSRRCSQSAIILLIFSSGRININRTESTVNPRYSSICVGNFDDLGKFITNPSFLSNHTVAVA